MSTQQHYYQTPGHVIAAGVGLAIVDAVAVLLRFGARRDSKQPLKTDDWLLLPATFLSVAVGACLVYGARHKAFGYYQERGPSGALTPEAMRFVSMAIKLEWTISVMLPVALACTKLSILFFYRRIFFISKSINRILTITMIFTGVWALVFVLAALFCCGDMLTRIWRPISDMAYCLVFLQVFLALCISGFVSDVLIISIPIPLIWRLNLSTRSKIIATVTFLLGAVTLGASLARIIISARFIQDAINPKKDFTLNVTLYCYWAMVECSVGVFAACLPALKPFFRGNTWQSVAGKTRTLFTGSRNTHFTNTQNTRRPTSSGSQDIRLVDTVDPGLNKSRDFGTPPEHRVG